MTEVTEVHEMEREERAIARAIEEEKCFTRGTVLRVRSMGIETESGGCCCDSASAELEVYYTTAATQWNSLTIGSYEVDDFICKVAAAAFEIAEEEKNGTAQ